MRPFYSRHVSLERNGGDRRELAEMPLWAEAVVASGQPDSNHKEMDANGSF